MRIVHAAAALAAAVAVAGPGLAAPAAASGEAAAERIAINQVDFRDAAQVRALYKRLQQAAMFVCGVQPGGDRAEREEGRACSERALRDAVQTANRPLLTATYEQAGAPMLARGY